MDQGKIRPMRRLHHAALVLVTLTGCPGGLGVAPCESPADCPASLLVGQQCSVLACGPMGAATPHCYVAPAPVGAPCTAHNDAGVAVCWGSCSADTSCVYEAGEACGK